jgi:hypothetical protein
MQVLVDRRQAAAGFFGRPRRGDRLANEPAGSLDEGRQGPSHRQPMEELIDVMATTGPYPIIGKRSKSVRR